jgi:hypothetical protein
MTALRAITRNSRINEPPPIRYAVRSALSRLAATATEASAAIRFSTKPPRTPTDSSDGNRVTILSSLTAPAGSAAARVRNSVPTRKPNASCSAR